MRKRVGTDARGIGRSTHLICSPAVQTMPGAPSAVYMSVAVAYVSLLDVF